MFTRKDQQQFKDKCIEIQTVEKQIENFKKGFPFANIIAPATYEKGIVKLNNEQISEYIKLYEKALTTEKIVKFVPASGAASRMFKILFEFMKNDNGNDKPPKDTGFNSTGFFFKNLKNFAFYKDLKSICKKNGINMDKDFVKILEYLLTDSGLNYGKLPKGLLKFHKYYDKSRTPVEEHLTEGANYGNSSGEVYIHFTVSAEHKTIFEEHIKNILPEYENKFNVKFDISYSEQKPSTDTIAVDMQNRPFRHDGSILFRPGGHGALIENLNDIEADIIFIKNIDNVVPDRLKADTYMYKKALAGLLINKRNKIYDYIKKLKKSCDKDQLDEVFLFLKKSFQFEPDNNFLRKKNCEKRDYLLAKLNRPLRVCGMVRNEGEPGGGPFIVKKESGSESLQIIESAQIEPENPEKIDIIKKATHFNPVDLITAVKDYKGNSFNLNDFIDRETGFIAYKSKDGKELKAQELPGLWNGAMSEWNTIFVEVPITTFNPVKIINDLLRPQHTFTK